MTREKSIEQMMWEANSISRDLRDRLEKTHSLGNDMCEMIWNSFIGPKLKSNDRYTIQMGKCQNKNLCRRVELSPARPCGVEVA